MLGKYKGIKVRKPIHTVTQKDLDEEVLRLRRMNATFSEVDTAADEEHVVTADLQDVDERGMPILGKRSQDVRFYLADDKLEAPFKEALRGAEKSGEYFVSFEHDHGDHKHMVRSRVTAKKVEKVALPDFDDAFVAKLTKDKVTTTQVFLANLRTDLEDYWKTRSDRAVVNVLTHDLLELHDFQVPESFVRAVMEGLLKDVAEQSPKKVLPDDFNHERFWEENKTYAEAQAKWALLREELIREENIVVTDDDLLALAEREAPKINIDKDRLLGYYKTSDQIRDRLTGEKLIERLLSFATVDEVDDTTVSSEKEG
jgi:trigger factor